MRFRSSGIVIVFCLLLTLARASPISNRGEVSYGKRDPPPVPAAGGVADTAGGGVADTAGGGVADTAGNVADAAGGGVADTAGNVAAAAADGGPNGAPQLDGGEPIVLPDDQVPDMDGDLGILDSADQGIASETPPQ
jgi:hypothetical protein